MVYKRDKNLRKLNSRRRRIKVTLPCFKPLHKTPRTWSGQTKICLKAEAKSQCKREERLQSTIKSDKTVDCDNTGRQKTRDP